jgi:hypothetical protein
MRQEGSGSNQLAKVVPHLVLLAGLSFSAFSRASWAFFESRPLDALLLSPSRLLSSPLQLSWLPRLMFCFHLSHFSAESRIDSALPSFFEPATSLQLALSPGDQFCLLAWYGEEPVSTKDVGHIESALAALKPIQDLAKNWDIDIAAW